jgi:hypothetical protein
VSHVPTCIRVKRYVIQLEQVSRLARRFVARA